MSNPTQNPKETVYYGRWNIHQRLQHILMGVSFIFLALTGLPIKYHTADISLKIAEIFGGYDGLMFVHKLNAAIMLVTSAYHLLFLLYYFLVKKQVSWAMVPTLKDGKDIVQGIKYALGKTTEHPKFDRYSWKEKFDYLAVFWGMLAIGATGVFMWIPDTITQVFPRWVIDCARMAHSDEAVLAVTFIGFVHFYNVHFCADIFPMNKVWMTGRISREQMQLEHSLELDKWEANAQSKGNLEEAATLENLCTTPELQDNGFEEIDFGNDCNECPLRDKCESRKED